MKIVSDKYKENLVNLNHSDAANAKLKRKPTAL